MPYFFLENGITFFQLQGITCIKRTSAGCCKEEVSCLIPSLVFDGIGWRHVVHFGWSSPPTYQITEITTNCYREMCDLCRVYDRLESFLVSTYPITNIWEFNWGLQIGTVFHTLTRIPTYCRCIA